METDRSQVPGQSLLSSPPNPPYLVPAAGLFGGQVLPQHGEEGALQDVGEDPGAEPPEEDARDPVLARRRERNFKSLQVPTMWADFGNLMGLIFICLSLGLSVCLSICPCRPIHH